MMQIKPDPLMSTANECGKICNAGIYDIGGKIRSMIGEAFFAERLSEKCQVPQWVRHRYLARYHWVLPQIRQKRVVDGACGSGDASMLLAQAGAHSVLAVDISVEDIDKAKCRNPHKNLVFQQQNLLDLNIPTHTVDAFISFETIEHIEDVEAFLSEVKRVLVPGGLFICSTPNRKFSNPGCTLAEKPLNPFHVREYTSSELSALLSRYFNSIQLFGQELWSSRYCAQLAEWARPYPVVPAGYHQVKKLIAGASDRYESHVPRPVVSDMEAESLIPVCR